MENLLLLLAAWYGGTWLLGRSGTQTFVDLYRRLPREVAVWSASVVIIAITIPKEWQRRGTIVAVFMVVLAVLMMSRGRQEQVTTKRKGGTQKLEPRPNAKNADLFAAVEKGDSTAIGPLVHEGAEVNSQNADGETPLHVACRMGYTQVVDALLKHGADFHVRNAGGKTPLQVANEAGYNDVGDVIRRHIESIRQVPVTVQTQTTPPPPAVEPPPQPPAASVEDVWEAIHQHLDDNNLEAANAELDRILKDSPEDADAWNLKGTTLVRMARFNEALRALDKAVVLTPDSALTLRLKGLCLLQLGQPAAAAIWFERALSSQPTDVNARLSLAEALEEQEKWDDALAAYDDVLQRVPDHPTAMNQKAACLADAGRLEEAVVMTKKAVERHPDDPSTWMLRSILLDWVGNGEGSESAQAKATQLGAASDLHLLDLRRAWANPLDRLN